VPGVSDRANAGHAAQSLDHTQVKLLWWAGITAGGVAEDQVFFTDEFECSLDFLERGHSSRDDQRFARGAVSPQQLQVRQKRGRNFMGRGIESLDELQRRDIPRGGKPVDTNFFGISIDFRVSFLIELHFVAVFQVRDIAPGGVAHLVALMFRHTQFGCPFLEFDRIGAGIFGNLHQFFCDINVAIVVYSDFANYISGISVTNLAVTNTHFTIHVRS